MSGKHPNPLYRSFVSDVAYTFRAWPVRVGVVCVVVALAGVGVWSRFSAVEAVSEAEASASAAAASASASAAAKLAEVNAVLSVRLSGAKQVLDGEECEGGCEELARVYRECSFARSAGDDLGRVRECGQRLEELTRKVREDAEVARAAEREAVVEKAAREALEAREREAAAEREAQAAKEAQAQAEAEAEAEAQAQVRETEPQTQQLQLQPQPVQVQVRTATRTVTCTAPSTIVVSGVGDLAVNGRPVSTGASVSGTDFTVTATGSSPQVQVTWSSDSGTCQVF